MAFTYGVRHMKRRKLRTLLVITTLIVVTFSLVSFSSVIGTKNVIASIKHDSTPSYKGILLRRPIGTPPYHPEPISKLILPYLSLYQHNHPEMIISPRVWLYPQSMSGARVISTFVKSETSSYQFSALLGLKPEEFSIFDIYKLSLNGRWFINHEKDVCIITKKAATRLGVEVGDQIIWGGKRLKIIGILDSEMLANVRDLDNYPIVPVDPNLIGSIVMGAIRQEDERWNPLPWDAVLIVPYELAVEYGGYIDSVAIRIENSTLINQISEELATNLYSLMIYSCDGKIVKTFSSFNYFAFQGATTLLPIAIGLMTVFNTVLGSIKERTKEISIYASVGVSPSEISKIFIAEEFVYALIGSLIGYLAGLALNIELISSGMLPKTFILNYSSSYVLISLIGTILCTLLASLYPVRVASKMLTPSFERKWKLTTKPKGNLWEVTLPFVFTGELEAKQFLNYLEEYFKAHTVETTEIFITRNVYFKGDQLDVIVSLKPADSGVIQRVTFLPELSEGKYKFTLLIERLGGVRESWLHSNYRFVDSIRKQFLVWRGLPPSEKQKYTKK